MAGAGNWSNDPGWDHFGGAGKNKNNAPTDEQMAAVFREMQLDVFRNDPIYQTAFDHGDFGDIYDADFDTFGKVKTFIADSIFATDDSNNTSNTSSTSGGQYYPEYVDVSAYYEEYTPPKMYAEPADIEMPEILKKYNTNPAAKPVLLEPGDDAYPADLSNLDTYQQEMDHPTHQKTWRTIRTKADFNIDETSAKTAKKALKQIGMKDNDEGWKALDHWMQISGTKNLKGNKDLKRFKETTRKYGGVLPESPPKEIFN